MSARRFEEMLGQFSRWGYDEKGWAANTRTQYVGRVRAAEAWLKEHRRVSLPYATPKDLKAYLFSTAPVARSRNNIRQALSGFGAFLVEAGYLEVNAASALPTLPEPRRIPRAIPGKICSRIEQVAHTFDPKVCALVLVFLYGGLRRNEARLLEWSDLDLEDGWFRFRGKGDVERAVPMHPAVRDALIFWKIACPDARFVFPGRWGDRPVSLTWISEHIRDVGVAVGIHLHPHLMRHSIATSLLNGPLEGNIRALQVFLGHASIQTTAPYARVWPADLQAAVRRHRYGDREVSDKAGTGHPQEQAHRDKSNEENNEADTGGSV